MKVGEELSPDLVDFLFFLGGGDIPIIFLGLTGDFQVNNRIQIWECLRIHIPLS